MKYYMVFSSVGDAGIFNLFINPRFRHCFMVVCDDVQKTHVVIDPLSNVTEIDIYACVPDLDFYEKYFDCVVECERKSLVKKKLPFQWYSCVEACKRVLGYRSWLIWTPYQLYKAAISNGGRRL